MARNRAGHHDKEKYLLHGFESTGNRCGLYLSRRSSLSPDRMLFVHVLGISPAEDIRTQLLNRNWPRVAAVKELAAMPPVIHIEWTAKSHVSEVYRFS
ncbi:MAG: hypothetical protein NVSMB62_06070 [Acidobacteriaceae bacterium]